MKTALVIHPYLSVFAGGEVVCLHVLNALKKAGYRVLLFADVANVSDAMKFYPEIGGVLGEVEKVWLPVSKRIVLLPGMRMLHTAASERMIYRCLEPLEPDVAISTQSSIYTMSPLTRLIHFTYDYTDLFVFSAYTRMRDWKPNLEKLKFRTFQAYTEGRRLSRLALRRSFGLEQPRPNLIATPSSILLRILHEKGYSNAVSFVPPARLYTPLPKKRQVIQVTRLVHAKRVELFLEAARRLPGEKFVLIARKQEGAVEYGRWILSHAPSNVEVIEGNLKDHIDRLRESKIYAYTGRDRAIMLSVAEAISAGCYPIVSADSAALDVESIATTGSAFHNIEELVSLIKHWLDTPTDPDRISEYAAPFAPANFEAWVQRIAAGS